MDSLIDGYRRFRAGAWPERRAVFERLARTGQAPHALVIACADSRADPAMIFDAAPGELFVVRNVANLVPGYAPDTNYHGTSAALEFAVRVLQVPHVVVMGHAMCGGVRAMLDGVPATAGDFLANWISIGAPARALAEGAGEDRQLACEREVVKLSLGNLMTFPWLAARVRAGELLLHGAHFGIANGVLELLGEDGRFAPV